MLARTREERAVVCARQWLHTGLLSLLLSGFLAGVIVLARTPFIAGLIDDPEIARRALVLHVDLSLLVWMFAFLAVLYTALGGRINWNNSMAGIRLVVIGIVLMVASGVFRSATPVLANYIPVLDHPVFFFGLLFGGTGLVYAFISNPLRAAEEPACPTITPQWRQSGAQTSIRFAALVAVVAIVTIAVTFLVTPSGLNQTTFYEVAMWGGGHILQFASVLGMITVWLVLLNRLTGQPLVSPRVNQALILILAIPALLSPLLLLAGTTSQTYYSGFTYLMRWFIFPVVSVYMVTGVLRLATVARKGKLNRSALWGMCLNGFAVSALLTLTGFILGAMIRTSTTLIPAHYHASLGGVTVAYMVMVFLLLREFGYGLNDRRSLRLIRLQPLLFGLGQFIFVIGFAYAGLQGMGRKMFGSDQNIHSFEALIGLGLMSIGGMLAMAGGLIFIWMVFKSYINGKT
ncbi:MAG: hypothetical protein ACNA8K_08075 [Cyclonatronaceae bacterium]